MDRQWAAVPIKLLVESRESPLRCSVVGGDSSSSSSSSSSNRRIIPNVNCVFLSDVVTTN